MQSSGLCPQGSNPGGTAGGPRDLPFPFPRGFGCRRSEQYHPEALQPHLTATKPLSNRKHTLPAPPHSNRHPAMPRLCLGHLQPHTETQTSVTLDPHTWLLLLSIFISPLCQAHQVFWKEQARRSWSYLGTANVRARGAPELALLSQNYPCLDTRLATATRFQEEGGPQKLFRGFEGMQTRP